MQDHCLLTRLPSFVSAESLQLPGVWSRDIAQEERASRRHETANGRGQSYGRRTSIFPSFF